MSCAETGAKVVHKRCGGGRGESDAAEASATPPPAVSTEKEAVLLDVRNVYETSIGHFRCALGASLPFHPLSNGTTHPAKKSLFCTGRVNSVAENRGRFESTGSRASSAASPWGVGARRVPKLVCRGELPPPWFRPSLLRARLRASTEP